METLGTSSGYYQGAEQMLFAGWMKFKSTTLKGKHLVLFTALGRLFVMKKAFMCESWEVVHTAHACGVQAIQRGATEGQLSVEFKPTSGGFTLQVCQATSTCT